MSKADRISEFGSITEKGQLRLPNDRVSAFLLANKGKRVVVRFDAVSPGSSELQLAYYYKYIVPTISAALYEQGTIMRDANVDKWLIDQYPGEKEERVFGTGEDVTTARGMDRRQMSDFLSWLKVFAAEDLAVYIEDPRTL